MKPLISGERIAWDTETTGLNPWKGDAPFAFSFCNEDGDTAYVEFKVDPATRAVLYRDQPNDVKRLRRFFADPERTKIAFNLKFDYRMVSMNLCPINGTLEECMFAAHCVNSGEPTFGLKPLAKKYADFPDDDQKRLQEEVVRLRRAAKLKGWEIAPDVEADYWLTMYWKELGGDPAVAELCREYAVKDAERTMLLWLFYEDIMGELNVDGTYENEMEGWRVTYDMEMAGVRVDLKKATALEKQYKDEHDHYLSGLMAAGEKARKLGLLDRREAGVVTEIDYKVRDGLPKRIRVLGDKAMKPVWFPPKFVTREDGKRRKISVEDRVKVHKPFADPVFNPDSDGQMASVLYDYLKLPVIRNSYRDAKRKNPHTRPVDADTLVVLANEHKSEFCEDILKWRACAKALNFLHDYKHAAAWDPKAKCWILHADFNQCGPRTGRFSCRKPNLQQAPTRQASRSAHPIDARAPFGPRPGHRWYCIDYSQLEVRVFADLSQESEMLRLIRSGQHLHSACANHVWGAPRGWNDRAEKEAISSLGLDRQDESGDEPLMREARKAIYGQYTVPRSKWASVAKAWLWDQFQGDVVAAQKTLDRKNAVNKAKLAIFTRIFGGGLPSIMNLLKCGREEAKQFLTDYAEAFPEMEPWIKSVTREARQTGCTWTAFGRRIAVDMEKPYRAVNNKVQGSAADLMKRGMRACAGYLEDAGQPGWIVMTIHDELVFEFRKGVPVMGHIRRLKEIMEDHGGYLGLEMPTEVEVVESRWDLKRKARWAA